MSRQGFGGTMGQDWGGKRPLNPDNCLKISSKQVYERANHLGIKIKREGLGMWWYQKNDCWFTLGQTNYLAFMHLLKVGKEFKNAT